MIRSNGMTPSNGTSTLARRLGAFVFSGMLALSAASCAKDEFDPNTWIPKLSDPKSSERAVTALERLGDPMAIPALGKAWDKGGRQERILRVIIELSAPLTEEKAKELYKYNGKARPASWDKSLPILKLAIEEVDKDNPRSVESARLAAEALGKSKLDGALEILVSAANTAKAKPLRGQAILSLGDLGDARAVPALANIIREEFNIARPELHGAAIIALGRIKTPESVPVLLEAMYRLPFFFKQVRRALVASGSDVVSGRISKILNGEDADINALFRDKKPDTYCGDPGKEQVAAADCSTVSAMDYYAGVIAGDLYDPSLVPALLKALGREPKPAYYLDFAPSPASGVTGALDALRKIGAADAAAPVIALWTSKDTDPNIRPMAANVFSYLSRDGSEKVGNTSAVDALGKIAADNGAEQRLRLEAAVAYARLATRADQIPLLRTQADKYQEASDKAKKEADGAPKAAYEKVKAPYDAAKAALDAAKKKVRDNGGEGKAPIEMINAVTAAKLEFDKVKDPYTKARTTWKTLEETSEAYRGYQRTFETHIARIEIAVHCNAKPDPLACRVGTLKQTGDEVLARLKPYINTAGYTDADKKDLVGAQIERAILDLGKAGRKADPILAELLDGVKSKDRLTRESVLLALPKIADKGCKECASKLDSAIKAAQGDTALASLNAETEVLRSYFSGTVEATP